jgi:hypothetical protein
MVVSEGFEPSSRPNLGLTGYKTAALPLSYETIKLVRHPGLEPGRFLQHRVLNPACLPFHQQRNKLVPHEGLEPPRLSASVSKTDMSANSISRAM